MERINEGEYIRWNFDENHPLYKVGGYKEKVAAILEEGYGIYREYGQDVIPFDSPNIITKEQNK